MEAKELRIGNVVKTNYGIRTITGIRIDNTDMELCRLGISGEYLILDLIPISLTEKILLKCGFDGEEIKYIDSQNRFNDKKKFTKSDLEIVINYGGLICVYYKSKLIKMSSNISLNQLQNLYFALTGKELDVSRLFD